ncbi:MAG TPA: hypothetical protein VGJ22_09935 [Anaerolineales bacterium]|jgi:hypothetical protein
MKIISILLALLNSLIAALVLASSLTATDLRDSLALWTVIKVAAALFVVAAGALTWLDSARPVRAEVLAASGLALVALGAAAAVWTLHLALATGDLEAYMVLYGGSLIVQGGASVLSSQAEPPQPAGA